MSITVRIPTPLRRVTNGEDKVTVEGSNLNEIIGSLDDQYPGIRARICNDQGDLRNFVNVYVNGEDVRFLLTLGQERLDDRFERGVLLTGKRGLADDTQLAGGLLEQTQQRLGRPDVPG